MYARNASSLGSCDSTMSNSYHTNIAGDSNDVIMYKGTC